MTNLTPTQRRALIKRRHNKKRKVDNSTETTIDQPTETTIDQNADSQPMIVDEIDERKKIEEYTKSLQLSYKDNVKRINADSSEDARFVKVAMIEAEEIWMNVQVLMKSKLYETMTDDKKINLIQKDFALFYKNFPIVARYMVCHGQYSSKAFKKMLINCKNTKSTESNQQPTMDPTDIKGKGKMPDTEPVKKDNELIWIERQADYVRFLWEDYQVNFSQIDSDNVWKQAYDLLSKEFSEFKEVHKKMEQKVKDDAIKHKKELLYEMSERIITGAQSLDVKKTTDLITKLKKKVFKQRYDNIMKDLLTTRCVTPFVTSGVGSNEERQKEHENELQQSYYKKNYKKMDFDKLKI